MVSMLATLWWTSNRADAEDGVAVETLPVPIPVRSLPSSTADNPLLKSPWGPMTEAVEKAAQRVQAGGLVHEAEYDLHIKQRLTWETAIENNPYSDSALQAMQQWNAQVYEDNDLPPPPRNPYTR